MKPLSKALCVSLCVVLLLAVSLVTPAMARYTNTVHIATPYGEGLSTAQTLSTTAAVYDFGIYTVGMSDEDFAHTVRVIDTVPVSGVLRFSWDDTTLLHKDIAVLVDSKHYISVQNSGYVDYTVSSSSNVLEMPFSLLISSPEPRQATLDVSFYPDGSDEPTLFARYLLAVVEEGAVGTAPSFVADATAFLSDSLLMATVTTPDDVPGVWLSPADGVFAAGTRYCTASCANGATLLRDSAIYLPRTADTACAYVDLSAVTMDAQPLPMRVAASDTLHGDIECTPLGSASLTVELSDSAGVLSAQQPLTITLTPASALPNTDWQIFRRQGDAMIPVTVGAHLTVTSEGNVLTLATPGGAQPAGTYLLLVTQYYNDYPVTKTPIWFFIDYR